MEYTAKAMHKHVSFSALFMSLVVIAAMLRFTNLNWDLGNRIHPDEALIVNSAMNVRLFSDLDTGFHDYNGLSVYALRAVAQGVSALTHNQSSLHTPEGMTIVGRYISALVSTLTVVFIYILTLQFFPPVIALSSTMIVAFSPLGIQLAHFYTTDSILVALLVSLLLAITSYIRKNNTRTLLFIALTLGAAIATKNTGYFFAPLPILAIFLTQQSWQKKILHALLLLGITSIAFFILSPYSFVDFSGYMERSNYLQRLITGKLLYDWTMQFQQTTPIYWFIQTIWAFGPLAVFGPIGMLFLIHDWMKTGTKKELPVFLLSLWTIGFGVFLSFTYIKFIRYNAPLIIGYIVGFSYLFDRYRHVSRIQILLQCTIAIEIIYGIMFSTIYLSPHTTLTAAAWITKNIPNNAAVLREDWNNIIRYEKEPLVRKNLRIDSINLYTLTDSNKVNMMAKKLQANDYLILDSPKVRNTTRRLPDKYPYTSTFYSLMENGALGFVNVAEFTAYPHIGAIVLNDENAEETFTVFDHPVVRIYAKQRELTEREIYRMVTSGIR